MNLVDILIILLLIGALLRGLELGFVHQLFSTAGFFGGLFLGSLLVPHIVGLAHSPLGRLGLTLAATLGLAMIVLFFGEFIGVLIKRKVLLQNIMNHVDNALGAVLSALSVLALVWLGSAMLVKLPFPELQSTMRSSAIVTALDRRLPA